MSKISIRKNKVPFTQISNDLLNDKNISLTAKGVYCFMYSKPDNFNFTIKSLSGLLKEGERAIMNALKELKTYGWIEYKKRSSGAGEYFLNKNQDFIKRKAALGLKKSKYLYLISDLDKKNIKIGVTENVKQRLRNLQVSNPSILTVLFNIKDMAYLEYEIHKKFKSYQIKGEWFKYDELIINYFKSL